MHNELMRGGRGGAHTKWDQRLFFELSSELLKAPFLMKVPGDFCELRAMQGQAASLQVTIEGGGQ